MQRKHVIVCGVVVCLLAGVAQAQHRASRVSASLSGDNEVPAVSTTAGGQFKADIDDAAQAVDYELTFSGLRGNVTMAHIHFGQPFANGGVMVWLCGTTVQPGPAGTPTCPAAGGTVTGTVDAADIQQVGGNPPGSQGIAPGEFAEMVAAIRKGLAYVNVHSSTSPGGEIRGQIVPGNR
jgi:hypothetical protein